MPPLKVPSVRQSPIFRAETPPTTTTTTTSTTTTSEQTTTELTWSSSHLCADGGKFDAISMLADGFTYIFKGAYVFKMSAANVSSGGGGGVGGVVEAGFPRLISSLFASSTLGDGGSGKTRLPSNLDAVLHLVDYEVTYYFKGSVYWRSSTPSRPYLLDAGYPRRISENFRGLNERNGFPGRLDASFVWSGNGRVYFVSADRYWRYDFEAGRVDAAYPKRLAVWRGLPARISDAFLHADGTTYFFDDEARFYAFDDLAFRVDDAYPRLISQYWLNCDRNKLGTYTHTHLFHAFSIMFKYIHICL